MNADDIRVPWNELYEEARGRPDTAAGYYNHNVRIDGGAGPVMIRTPIRQAEVMDLRLWREEDVLTAIAPYVPHAPRLLHASAAPPFQVHEFVGGDLLNDVAPRGVAVPSHVLGDVVRLFVQLTRIPVERLPPVPDTWPRNGDTTAFGQRLCALTQRVYDTHRDEYGALYERLGVPDAPLACMEQRWARLTPRPFTCVHSDVHRRNIIVDEGVCTFLDWELALWGDPLYEPTVHIHKMAYRPAERNSLLARWIAGMPREHTTAWEDDLEVYLTHERIKSALVDPVRYARLFSQGGPFPYPPKQLIASTTAKLNAARTLWGRSHPIDVHTVHAAFTRPGSNVP